HATGLRFGLQRGTATAGHLPVWQRLRVRPGRQRGARGVRLRPTGERDEGGHLAACDGPGPCAVRGSGVKGGALRVPAPVLAANSVYMAICSCCAIVSRSSWVSVYPIFCSCCLIYVGDQSLG